MFHYPARFALDILVLLTVLLIPTCAFYEGFRSAPPTPPCVDMSGTTLEWHGTTEVQRLPPCGPTI